MEAGDVGVAAPLGVTGGFVVAADVALAAGDTRGSGATRRMPARLVPGRGEDMEPGVGHLPLHIGDSVDLGVAAHPRHLGDWIACGVTACPRLCGDGKELGVLLRCGEGVGVPGAAASQALPALVFRLAFLPAVVRLVWASRNLKVLFRISLDALSLHRARLDIRLVNF